MDWKLGIYNSRNYITLLGLKSMTWMMEWIYNSRNYITLLGNTLASPDHTIYNSRNYITLLG